MNAVSIRRRCQLRPALTHAERAGPRAKWRRPRGGVFNTTHSKRNEVGKTATCGDSDPRFDCVEQHPAAVEQRGER